VSGQSTSSSLGSLAAVFPVAITVGVAVLLVRRDRAESPRRASPMVVAIVGLVLGVGGLVLGFAGSGGVERALAPGPLAGDASFGVVLEAEGRFAATDAEAMVARIETLGADAEIESSDAQRIALRVSNAAGVREVVDAIRPRSLEFRFANTFETDPLADVPGLTPEPGPDPTRSGVGVWRADCETARLAAERPVEACDLVVGPDESEEGRCALRCLDREVLVDGTDIANARMSVDPMMGVPVVTVELEPAAAERFEAATGANLMRVLAIVVECRHRRVSGRQICRSRRQRSAARKV